VENLNTQTSVKCRRRPALSPNGATTGVVAPGNNQRRKAALAKKVLYIDMDNTLVDFGAGLEKVDPAIR
jgi:hypothetical protein